MIECCPHGDFLADNPRTARQECNQGSQGKQKYSFTYRHLWGKTSCSSGRILQSALPCLLLGSLSCPCPSRAVPSSFYYILYLEKKILVPCQYLLKQSIIYPKLFFFLFCVTFYMMVRYRCLWQLFTVRKRSWMRDRPASWKPNSAFGEEENIPTICHIPFPLMIQHFIHMFLVPEESVALPYPRDKYCTPYSGDLLQLIEIYSLFLLALWVTVLPSCCVILFWLSSPRTLGFQNAVDHLCISRASFFQKTPSQWYEA